MLNTVLMNVKGLITKKIIRYRIIQRSENKSEKHREKNKESITKGRKQVDKTYKKLLTLMFFSEN